MINQPHGPKLLLADLLIGVFSVFFIIFFFSFSLRGTEKIIRRVCLFG